MPWKLGMLLLKGLIKDLQSGFHTEFRHRITQMQELFSSEVFEVLSTKTVTEIEKWFSKIGFIQRQNGRVDCVKFNTFWMPRFQSELIRYVFPYPGLSSVFVSLVAELVVVLAAQPMCYLFFTTSVRLVPEIVCNSDMYLLTFAQWFTVEKVKSVIIIYELNLLYN